MIGSQSRVVEIDPYDRAEKRGRGAAVAFDARLRELELEECERLLGQERRGEPGSDEARAATVRRLEVELESLREFRHSVIHSRAWRLIQFLRRLVGRAW